MFILAFLFIFIMGYIKENNNNLETSNNDNHIVEEKKEEEINKFIDTNPIILGLYKYYGSDKNRELITEYTANWEYHKDISSFEVYYTQEKEITGQNQIKTFDLYKDNYDNIDNYRIGYKINFKTNDKEYNTEIIRPRETEEFSDYLEIYLYDDYHRTGGWYSHTTDSEFNENTLFTSIKLTAGKKVNEITSPIKVTAFTYNISTDFDENGLYRGNSLYQITVNKK